MAMLFGWWDQKGVMYYELLRAITLNKQLLAFLLNFMGFLKKKWAITDTFCIEQCKHNFISFNKKKKRLQQ